MEEIYDIFTTDEMAMSIEVKPLILNDPYISKCGVEFMLFVDFDNAKENKVVNDEYFIGTMFSYN